MHWGPTANWEGMRFNSINVPQVVEVNQPLEAFVAPDTIKRAQTATLRRLQLDERSPTGVSTLSSLHRFDFSSVLLCLLGSKPKPHRAGSAPDVPHVPCVHLQGFGLALQRS